MFEQEINETIQRITRDVLQDKTLIPLVEILEKPSISNRFKAFFETEVHWWIYTESLSRKRDRRFDFSHPEIASLLSYLEQIQAKHAQFERDDFLSVLDKGVKLSYNYICRPQTTLKWYVFRGEPTKPLGETMLRMNAFRDYPYFKTVFTDWVDRKREERPTFDSISAREFERIIRRIDDQILLSCTIEELRDIIYPLFDFIGKGEARSVPIDALIVYFDDKHIARLVEFLEKKREQQSHVTLESFSHLIEELLSSADDELEADFSSVYQNDTLDAVVREHLQESDAREEEVMEAVNGIKGESPSSPVQQGQPEEEEAALPPEEEGEEVVVDESPSEMEPERESIRSDNDEAESLVPNSDQLPLEENEPESESEAVQRASDEFFIGLRPLDDDDVEPGDVGVVELEEDDELDTATDQIIDILVEPENGGQIIVGERHEFELGGGYSSESVEEKETSQTVASDDEVIEKSIPSEPEVVEARDEEIAENGDEVDDGLIEEGQVDTDEGTVEDDGPPTAQNLSDIRVHIDAMLERKVIKKIFARNRGQYEETLEALNKAGSWRDASKVLDELFIRFDVDPYSRTAIRFTDAIYGRYLTTVSGI